MIKPSAPAPHDGEHFAAHPEDAEEIGIELSLGFREADVFHGAGEGEAGAIDEDVDSALDVRDLPYRLRDRFVRTDVQLNHFYATNIGGDGIFRAGIGRSARRAIHLGPVGGKETRQGLPDSR